MWFKDDLFVSICVLMSASSPHTHQVQGLDQTLGSGLGRHLILGWIANICNTFQIIHFRFLTDRNWLLEPMKATTPRTIPTFKRRVNYYPQYVCPSSPGRSQTILKTVTPHPKDGHPPFQLWSPTIPRKVTHPLWDGHLPSTGQSPTISRPIIQETKAERVLLDIL